MRRLLVLVLVAAACRIERIDPPGGRATARDPADSAIVAALDTYYDRFSRRAWDEFRESFWPQAVIAVRWQPPGVPAPVVAVQPLDTFLARTREGPDRLAVFEERMVHHEIKRYGDLAAVWATFRATFGERGAAAATHYGVDAFQLLEQGGEWRIVALTFTAERAGDSLPKGRAAP
jgi:hypothetical protein